MQLGMKRRLARLTTTSRGLLCVTLLAFAGCGGGAGSSGLLQYSILYTFINNGTTSATFVGRDVSGQQETQLDTVLAGQSVTEHADLLTSVLNQSTISLSGRLYTTNLNLIGTVSLDGVSVADGKITYVDLKWDGSSLFIHAHHPPGNPN